MDNLRVDLPRRAERSYEVVFGLCQPFEIAGELAAFAAPSRWLVISDSTVGPLYAEPLVAVLREVVADTDLLIFEAGEQSKNRATVAELQDQALAAAADRDAWVVAVGGGVVGDVAGLVAATLFRGLSYVQIPTTLLAMVDSSVGGKTGVDTDHGKNLVGAFHQPRRVLIDVGVLDTLADAELGAGMAEVIKYGVIVEEQLFVDLEDGLLDSCVARVPRALEEIISRCLRAKAEIVRADERESGCRKILNFGHTVGHAVEKVLSYRIRHGEAVAIGMTIESALAVELAGASSDLAGRVEELCRRCRLPVRLPAGCGADQVVEACRFDKKTQAGKLRMALPLEIGRMPGEEDDFTVVVSETNLLRVLQNHTGDS